MAYWTDLAAAVHRSGLPVVEVSGWQSRGHGGVASTPAGVVCHWTATPDTVRPDESFPSLGVVRDGRSDLPGPLANLGLGRDGTVYVIAAGLAYHAGAGYYDGIGSNGNYNTIGIEAEEGGDGDWTPAMLDAYPRLCAALVDHYGIPVSRVIGHHEWAPGRKVDISSWPGGMAAFRSNVTQIVNGGGGDPLPENPWPLPKGHYFGDISGPEESHGGYYAHERPWVAQIQRKFQELGHAPSYAAWADGIWEPPTTLACQKWQRATGRSVTGRVYEADWYALFPPPAPKPSKPKLNTDPYQECSMLLPAGEKQHVVIPAAGRPPYLYVYTTAGRNVDCHEIKFIGPTPSGTGAKYTGPSKKINFLSDRPGPVRIPDGTVGVALYYTADHPFTAFVG